MKIAIIGAGVAGLTAAYRLTQHAHQVDIFEASDHLGGLASCFMLEHENAKLEKYYHHIFISDLFIRNLVKELNMEQDLLWLESSMGFYTQDQLYPFGSPSQLLHFSPLPFLDRIRFGLVVLYLGKVHQWKKYEKITAYEWISKYFGPNILKIIWEPLLRGKFGTFYNQVAMAWFWARVHTRASSRQGSIEKLGYFRGGFASLHDRLAATILTQGGKIHFNTPVQKILTTNHHLSGLLVADQEKKYDKLIFTAATPAFLNLCPSLPQDYITNTTQLEFLAAQCLILVMNQPFTDIYWLNISDPEIPIMALIEHTNLVPKEWYNQKHILYIANYLPKNHRLFQIPKETLIQEYLPYLKKINPNFDLSWIENSYLFRDGYAQPLIPLNYSQIKPQYQTPIQDVILANTSLVYPEDRGTNFAVDVGNQAAQLVDSSIQLKTFYE